MRIGIYNEPAGGGPGGAEGLVAVLAQLLAQFHEVDLVHHRPDLTAEQLYELSGVDLADVRLRYVQPEGYSTSPSLNPWRRYNSARAWHANLSQPYDLFIASLHGLPPFCHAPRGALLVLFPNYQPDESTRGSLAPTNVVEVKRRLGQSYRQWEWKRRMSSYQVKAAISHYSADWARRRWGIECEVVHPPVSAHFASREKSNLILSVGRFAIEREGHRKQQGEMLRAFRDMERGALTGWRYMSVGGLGSTAEHRAFLNHLRDAAQGCHAEVLPNIQRETLRTLYEGAAIFWHAAGYGEDLDAHPERAEHFGMSTVEAMAAGCVPIVIDRGGQREIVEHGVAGFRWNTVAELKAYTLMVIGDAQLRARMSEASRIRSRQFSREQFSDRFLSHLQPLRP